MGKSIFGDNSKKVDIEREQLNAEYQRKVLTLPHTVQQ